MNKVFNLSLAALCTTLSFSSATVFAADETIKVGVLHSLSGTMAISETTLKDTVLMLIEEQNKKGGLLGKKLEPVVVDPASNWPLLQKKRVSLSKKRKWMWCSVVGHRYHVNRCCLSLKNSTASFFTQFSMKAKSLLKTFSTLAQRQTNKRSQQWIT